MVTPRAEGQASTLRETHLRDYWKIVWQGRYTIVAVFLLVVVATAVHTYLQTPIYRATATVEVQPQPRQLAPGEDVSGLGVAGYGWWAEEKYHNTQLEVIKSRDVSQRAFNTLGLRDVPMFAERPDPVGAFRKLILVDPRRDTGLIEISIHGADRDEITRWVNVVAKAYVDRNIEKAEGNVRRAVEEIRHQLMPLEAELSEAEEQGFKVLQQTQIFDPKSQEEILQKKLGKYSEELTAIQIKLARLQNRLEKMRELQQSGGDPMSLPELADDHVLRDLNKQKLALERDIEKFKVTLRRSHPKYEEKLGELAKVEQKIQDQVGLIVANIENQYGLEQKNEVGLREQMRSAEETAFEVSQATSEYEIKRTDAEAKKRVYDLIKSTMTEAQLATRLLTNNILILDEARPPLHPIKPRKKLNLLVGAMFGMFLGIGLVFFLDYLDNTFRTPQDIESYLGLSVLGVIPKFKEHEASSRAVREAYQSLRTSVIFSSKNRQRKSILVTSSGPQEGKSSAVYNLGKVLAGSGDRVMILDCDLRRPTQHQHLNVARDQGLTTFLAAPEEETDWTSYIKTTEFPNLRVIPCGPIPPSPPELLSSDRFKMLLAGLRKDYDWVLIDSPPAASLADSSLLASVSDMVVLIVQHNQTDRDLVVRTVQQLQALNATLVGAMLNNVDVDRYGKDYYYAGYYYYYYSEDREGRRKKRRSESKVKAQAG